MSTKGFFCTSSKGFNTKGFDKPLSIWRSIAYIFIFLGIAEATALILNILSH